MNTQEDSAHQDVDVVVGKRRDTRLDASQWRLFIEQQRRSGQSVRVFCLDHDLKEATFVSVP